MSSSLYIDINSSSALYIRKLVLGNGTRVVKYVKLVSLIEAKVDANAILPVS